METIKTIEERIVIYSGALNYAEKNKGNVEAIKAMLDAEREKLKKLKG